MARSAQRKAIMEAARKNAFWIDKLEWTGRRWYCEGKLDGKVYWCESFDFLGIVACIQAGDDPPYDCFVWDHPTLIPISIGSTSKAT